MQQTVNGAQTRYALDLNAGLTQVLADGSNTYLYGNGRIAQYQTAMQYFGADALGSVRQLYNASGQVIANARYDPYGNVLAQSGATSAYGYTGEQTDATGLVYLRARYYDGAQGRFTTRDEWEGDYNAPLTLNKWNYVQGNPVNLTDPSGRCEENGDEACWGVYEQIILVCPECARTMSWPPGTGDQPLYKASRRYLESVLERLRRESPRHINARVYFLNAIGPGIGSGQIAPNPDPNDFQGYVIFRVGQIVGPENVKHIPVFNDKYRPLLFCGDTCMTRFQMFAEMFECRIWSSEVANAIGDDFNTNPLPPGHRLIMIGESGGGTVAVESLDQLEQKGISVDQLILRGSPVQELALKNVKRVDYVTSNLDYYYSFKINPFDGVNVYEHRVDFWGHVPPTRDVKEKIADLIVRLILIAE